MAYLYFCMHNIPVLVQYHTQKVTGLSSNIFLQPLAPWLATTEDELKHIDSYTTVKTILTDLTKAKGK